MTEPDVTLTVTMSAEAFRFRRSAVQEGGASSAYHAIRSLDHAILAAPLPSPPVKRGDVVEWHGDGAPGIVLAFLIDGSDEAESPTALNAGP